MSTAYKPIIPITHQRDVFAQPVTALSFDPVSDILWSGSNVGTVFAYYGPRGLRGVSFPVGGDLAVKKLIAGENYVRAYGISSEGLGTWGKGGINKWYYRPASNTHVVTFSNTSNLSPLVAVSTNIPEILLLNSMTGTSVRQVASSSVMTHMHFLHSCLLSGSSDGYLRAHDPRTGLRRENGAENAVRAHANGIQGLQSSGNFVFTIGWTSRQSHPFPDPLVKVYDVRKLSPLPPVAFPAGPAFINVLPKRPSSLVVTSNQGLVNIVDATNPSANEFHQLDLTSYISSVAVSPTGAYIAFGDADGLIHLLSAGDGDDATPFNGFEGQPVEWPDTLEQLPDFEWSDSTPLNSVGMPYYDTQLLSSWTAKFLSTNAYYPPPVRIPPQISSTMKTNDNVAYAALPKELKGRRNVAPAGPRKDQGRFRSGKSRSTQSVSETIPADYYDEVPRLYRKVEIEYSKFGVEDFDFAFYNRTAFSGLETHILNSYTNCILQTVHYCLPIRRLAKSHIATNCPREHCLLCELGFVVRMLEDARGINCQSSNFCKAIGVLAQAQNALELIDYGREPVEIDYAHKIQQFHRFLIDHLSLEGNAFPQNPILVNVTGHESGIHSPAAAPITQLLGLDGKNVITCLSCKAVREKENMTHIVDMIYPRILNTSDSASLPDFVDILRSSLIRHMSYKATCQTCKQFANFSSQRSIPSHDLPAILAVNACVYNEENMKFWLDNRGQTFLKSEVQIQGYVDGVDDPEVVVYQLRALVVQIVAKDKCSHLVAIINVPESESEGSEDGSWFVFNDFAVDNISEAEALSFPGKWKVPAIAYFERVDLQEKLDFSGFSDKMGALILMRDTNISLNRDSNFVKQEPLTFDELPKPGTLVAIDAEFVSMQQEETEYRSDGTNKVIRPARLSLARVSVLRGNGSKQGVPFIDDHIHTSEVIVDYLTEFSGVKFGDLDPHLSRYTLTPLKLVYKKLRILVDRGCIFIGHGLSKDFRIINIFVPPDQVIDTVDLYFLRSRQRRLSLRFLTWFVLHENIQTDTHDSIEDARSALMLYKAYHEFEEKGIFDEKLEELYREGRKNNWKPPSLLLPRSTNSPPAVSGLMHAVPFIPGARTFSPTGVSSQHALAHSAGTPSRRRFQP